MSQITEMCTYRLPVSVINHLQHAHEVSELTKTVIVRRALEEFLQNHYPLPSAATAA